MEGKKIQTGRISITSRASGSNLSGQCPDVSRLVRASKIYKNKHEIPTGKEIGDWEKIEKRPCQTQHNKKNLQQMFFSIWSSRLHWHWGYFKEWEMRICALE